jgi:RND family efflux transporter MFP subunit
MRPVVQQQAAPQGSLDDAERDLAVAEAKLAARLADGANLRAELDRLKLMVEKAQTRAPFAGVVARRHVEIGQWIRQGDPVAEIVQLDPLYVRANVPENLVPQLAVGDTVRIVINALGNGPIEGHIDRILPEADRASRTVPVKIVVPNPHGKIKPGFFAQATFLKNIEGEQLVVPTDAVVRNGEMTHVVAMREGRSAIVPVAVLNRVGASSVISGDVKEGELVVTRGNEGLFPGMPLMPRNLGGPPPSKSGEPATEPTTQPQGAQ